MNNDQFILKLYIVILMNLLKVHEKILIENFVKQHCKKWKYISTLVPGRTENTIKSFYISYEKHRTRSHQREESRKKSHQKSKISWLI